MKIGLVTCRDLSRYFPSEDQPYLTHDDRAMAKALQQRGHQIRPIFWQESLGDDLESFDAVIVRSTWDYMQNLVNQQLFRRWLEEKQSCKTVLINPAKVMLWNFDKHYLADLQRQGVSIVPTEFLEPEDELSPAVLKGFYEKMGPFVLKPCISAAARDTFLIDDPEGIVNLACWNGVVGSDLKKWRAERTMLIQPFLEEIKGDGEWSLVYLGGEYSHAVRKLPQPGNWLVQDELGGSVQSTDPEPEMISFADKVFQAIPKAFSEASGERFDVSSLLYARIDIIETQEGFYVGEVELIEPELFFLKRDPDPYPFWPAINKFCEAVENMVAE